MALELLDTNPFATEAFSLSSTDRAGFTFDPSAYESDFESWKRDFEANLPNALTLDISPSLSVSSGSTAMYSSPSSNFMDSYGNLMLASSKKAGDTMSKTGGILKTVAAAGELFTNIMNYSHVRSNAERAARNTKKSVENQMLALDNQVMYYKNQITDKFASAMARNTVTMAAKNLRVTAGSLLEQTKDAAYDATKDIEMLESNAELKKIALRSEAKQAKVARDLIKTTATTDLLNSVGKLGLSIGTNYVSGNYGDLFSSGTSSLNETVYGG